MFEKKPYKINIGDTIVLNRKDIEKGENKYTFYSTKFSKKDKNGNTIYGVKGINFSKGTDIPDGTKIRINNMFEDFYVKGYQTIFTLFILEYEIVEFEEHNDKCFDNALNEYEEELGGF